MENWKKRKVLDVRLEDKLDAANIGKLVQKTGGKKRRK